MALSCYYNTQQLSVSFGWHSCISPAAGGSPSPCGTDLGCMGLKQRCVPGFEGSLKIPLPRSGARKSFRQISINNDNEKKIKSLLPKFPTLFPCYKTSVRENVAPKFYIKLLLKPLRMVDTAFKSAGEVLDVCVSEGPT